MLHVKENITLHLPSIIALVGENRFPWNDVEHLFDKEVDKQTKRCEALNTESVIVEANIFYLIIQAKKQNAQAIRHLDGLNQILTSLNNHLGMEGRKLLQPTIWSFLTAFDNRYQDFMGEMAILNNLMTTSRYNLKAVEMQLENSKTVDFVVQEKDDLWRFHLVEIMNIHLNDNKVQEDDQLIKNFIEGRINRKLKTKGEGLPEHMQLTVIPVLWGGHEALKIYSDFYKRNQLQLTGSQEPFAFMQMIHPENEKVYFHRFMRLSKIFDPINLLGSLNSFQTS